MDESAVDQEATPGLSCFVDVFDRVDLFDRIDNQTVVNLSSLGRKNRVFKCRFCSEIDRHSRCVAC